MSYSIIQKSQLEGALRLDAEYYQPEYLNLVKKLDELHAIPIRNIAVSVNRKFKPEKGKSFEYIEISKVDLENGEYNVIDILGENTPDRAQWVIEKGDIIISMVRPIRNAVSLISEDIKNLICSSGFAVLKAEKIEPEYLFVYLKSAPIVKLLDRLTTATMYPAITVEDILNTKIYLRSENFRKGIKDNIINAKKESENSKSLYQQAENLLLEELGLKNFSEKENLSSVVNLSDIKSAHRIDAEYFQDKYKKLIEVVKKHTEIKFLSDLFDFNRGIFISTDYYTEEKTLTPYLRIKELSEKGGINKEEIIYINEQYAGEENNKLKINDLVMAIIGDTIGKTNRIDKELVGGYYSNNTGRLRIKKEWENKILPECNELIFQSVLIQSQIEKKKAQTGQPKINDSEIRSIIVPILPKKIQDKIADLVRQSHEARKKAKELLEEAKRKVEELVEN